MLKGFKYLADENSNILILGTFPSEESRRLNEYYANKRNQFWRLLFEIYNCEYDKNINYDKKVEFLYNHQIALWDMIDSCITEGSLDSKILDPKLSNIEALLKKYKNIQKIFCNGKFSYKLLKSQNIEDHDVYILPSSSPTNTVKYEEKFKSWKNIIIGDVNNGKY